ncbi:hypothetical protein G3I61_28295 [Streptomyces diastaticus]|nr:hypothetical protein [Streptomyces diastaticus]
MIPQLDSGSLIMPTYHYASEEDGRAAIEQAHETAPVITTDDELYDARARGIAHKLSAGWIDPSMR